MAGRCVPHGLNRYKAICEIGEGAFGVVFKCIDLLTNEIVALKEFKSNNSEGNENITHSKNSFVKNIDNSVNNSKILREIATLRRLCGQKNIIQLKDFFLHENRYYLSLEYFPRTLLQYLEDSPNGIPIEVIKSCIYQLLTALRKCHSMGIIHRDVKPENILIKESQKKGDIELKLCDFGFARFIQNKNYQTKNDDNKYLSNSNRPLTSYVSTRWYRSPELLVKSTEYGASIDIWAVGCIMAELIDGEPLFPGTCDVDQLYLIRNCIGRLDEEHQSILERDTKFYDSYKKHIYKGFISGSNSKYNNNTSCRNIIPPFQILSLKDRYSGKLDSIAFSFLEKLLTIDPKKRPTSEELLSDPFFNEIRNEDSSEVNSDLLSVSFLDNQRNDSISNSFYPTEKLGVNLPSSKGLNRDMYDRLAINDKSLVSSKLGHNINNTIIFNEEKTTAPSTPENFQTQKPTNIRLKYTTNEGSINPINGQVISYFQNVWKASNYYKINSTQEKEQKY
ncbi:serine/threonine protein kinase KKIALRE [Cryptosporidium ryanae]|uniref:serine/threonine protein kinase KKIALRE n=1 Tax=Cryptosporidium ryanae TaxID=515981 RepID=UPI003519E3B5|nr:serine/threonine protein kinase KKIALRE [Cryptosporidium ryanae]